MKSRGVWGKMERKKEIARRTQAVVPICRMVESERWIKAWLGLRHPSSLSLCHKCLIHCFLCPQRGNKPKKNAGSEQKRHKTTEQLGIHNNCLYTTYKNRHHISADPHTHTQHILINVSH